MADTDTQKHEEILSSLKKARSADEAIGVATEALKHIFDHLAAQEARIKALEEKIANISGKSGKTFLG